MDDADLLEILAADPNTKCISLYIESLKDGRKFYETAKEVVKKKPVVALKSGWTEAGAKATSSHTGSIAGSDAAYSAAFRQAGIFRTRTLSDLFDASRALAYQPIPKGENIAILTNAGGPGVLAADTSHSLGLHLATLTEDTINKLGEICPPSWSKGNPIDMIGDAQERRYHDALTIVLDAEEVDGVIVMFSPSAISTPLKIAESIVDVASDYDKPVTASFVGMVSQDAENYLDMHGIPEMEYPERAVVAMHSLMERMRFLKREGLM